MTDPVPALDAEVSFTTGPLDTPSWTDLPNKVTSVRASYGRDNEQEQTQPGGLDLAIDNSTGDLTPGRAASTYYPNVTSDKPVRVRVTPPGGSVTALFRGHVESWPVDLAGGFDYAAGGLHANDGFALLNVPTLRSYYAEQVLADDPIAYYPMGDSGDRVGELTGSYASGRIVLGKGFAGGTYSRGATPLAPYDGNGSLLLTPHFTGTVNDGGYMVEITHPGSGNGPLLTPSGGWAISIAFNSNTNAATVTLFTQTDAAGDRQIEVVIGNNIALLYRIYDTPTTYEISSAPGQWLDGATHVAVLVLEADGQTMRTYIDGALEDTTVMASPAAFAAPSAAVYLSGPEPPRDLFYFSGKIAHLALWDTSLSAAQVTQQRLAWRGFPDDTSGERVGRILDLAGWPVGERAVDTGLSPVAPSNPNGLSPLAAIQQCADAEQGVFFIAPDGDATFQDRGHRITAASVLTLSAEDVEGDLTFLLDGMRVYNDVTVEAAGVTARAVDQASIDAHGRRTLPLSRPLVVDSEAQEHAEWVLLLTKAAQVRCPALTIDPLTTPALWADALTRTVSDRITVTDLPDTAPAATMDFFIEGVAHDGASGGDNTPAHWETSWPVSPAPATDWGIWDATDWDGSSVWSY